MINTDDIENDIVIDITNVTYDEEKKCKLVMLISSCKQPHENLIYIELKDSHNNFTKIEHYVEKNDLVTTLCANIMKSNDAIHNICGNTHVDDYRSKMVNILYNLCLKTTPDISSSNIKSI